MVNIKQRENPKTEWTTYALYSYDPTHKITYFVVLSSRRPNLLLVKGLARNQQSRSCRERIANGRPDCLPSVYLFLLTTQDLWLASLHASSLEDGAPQVKIVAQIDYVTCIDKAISVRVAGRRWIRRETAQKEIVYQIN